MYKPPIKVFLSAMHTEQEGEILKAVQKIGVEVSKEPLMAALAYDSQQYSKGYEDGWRDAQEWISVEDRLPEDSAEVNVFTEFRIVGSGYYDKYTKKWVQYDAGGALYVDVTHWMPMPEAPKEETP